MAGYMTKLAGRIYEGELTNGAEAPVENGLLMVAGTGANAGKMVLPNANNATKLLCKEVTTIYDGVVAYRFIVNALGLNLYLVENGFDVNDGADYDKRTYTTPVGALLRVHPLTVGEEFVTTAVEDTPTVGTEYGVTAEGKIGTIDAD